MTERGQRRLRLVLPWLKAAALADTPNGSPVARLPAAEWLVARAAARTRFAGHWRAWLLGQCGLEEGLLQRFPAGPCVRALQAGSRPDGTWACARPVHLLVAIDHLQLGAAALRLDAAESAALIDDVNRHLDGRGFRLHATSSGPDWVLECAAPIDCTSVEPAEAVGPNLRDLMPGGREGARVRSLMNEIQMLLHEHPVNAARAARRLPAVNSLWLWGFGQAAVPGAIDLPASWSDDAWFDGLWLMHGSQARPRRDFAAGFHDGPYDAMLLWAEAPSDDAGRALEAAERECFAPARTQLVRGAVREIVMFLGDREIRVTHDARLRFWRRPRPLREVLA